MRLVVEAVMKEEYEVEEEYEEENKPPPEILFPPMAMLPAMVPPVRARLPEAVPVRAAVMVPAEKLPLESRATKVFAVFVEEVATLPKVLTPVKYGMLPMTAAEEVDSPPKPTVVPERVMGQVTEMAACFPLKVL